MSDGDCQAQAWFAGADHVCPACGHGPCPRSFNLPVNGDDAQRDSRPLGYGAHAARYAERRGLVNVAEAASRAVGERRHVLYVGEPA